MLIILSECNYLFVLFCLSVCMLACVKVGFVDPARVQSFSTFATKFLAANAANAQVSL